MATLNVFEVTNAELSKSLKESKKPAKKANRKVIKESAKRIGGKYAKSKKTIAANRIHLESLQFVKEAEENDEVIDYTPDEEVVLVIDPEMEETPETVEDAEAEAEDIVGDIVCKCSICGANYLCDCDSIEEDLEEEEGVCPVCGETGEQIVVGEITPAEDVEVSDDEEEVDVDDEEEVDVDVDDDFADDDSDVDVDINIDVDGEEEEEEEEDEYEESIQRAKRRTMLRRESAKLSAKRPLARKLSAKKPATESKLSAKRPAVESKLSAKRPMPSRRPMTKKSVTESKKNLQLDEVTLNRMLTKFAKENYANVRFIKIQKGNLTKNGTLTLEGVLVTTKGSKRTTKFTCENFKTGKIVSAKFTETGAITESAINGKNAFTINFVNKNNVYTPTALTYNYAVKEGRQGFKVSGKVVNESLKKNRK